MSEWQHGNSEEKPNRGVKECKKSEIMDLIEIINYDVYTINDTGLTGEEYMEVTDGCTWYAANR